MSSLQTTLRGYISYRGREGQLSFLMHRITGLGTLLFLAIHIVDTATVYFFPDLYDHAIGLYQTTFFGIGEMALVFSVLYHGMNGLRIALFDWFPKMWKIETQRKSVIWTLIATVIIWLPLAVIMANNILYHNHNIQLFGG